MNIIKWGKNKYYYPYAKKHLYFLYKSKSLCGLYKNKNTVWVTEDKIKQKDKCKTCLAVKEANKTNE